MLQSGPTSPPLFYSVQFKKNNNPTNKKKPTPKESKEIWCLPLKSCNTRQKTDDEWRHQESHNPSLPQEMLRSLTLGSEKDAQIVYSEGLIHLSPSDTMVSVLDWAICRFGEMLPRSLVNAAAAAQLGVTTHWDDFIRSCQRCTLFRNTHSFFILIVI